MTVYDIMDEIVRQGEGTLSIRDAEQALLSMGGISPEDVFKVTVAFLPVGVQIQFHIDEPKTKVIM